MGPNTAHAENEVFKKNFAIADEYGATARAILSAQLEEFVLHLSKSGEMLTPAEVSEAYAKVFGTGLISNEFLDICRRLYSISALEIQRSGAGITDDSVAFTDNVFSSAAAEKLCPDAVKEHFSDFRSVCEAVFYEKCDCCILPVYGTDDGFFPTFFKLIKAYELKICRVCTVEKPSSDAEIRYALLTRSICFDNAEHFVFSFADTGERLAGLLAVLGGAGCTPAFIYSFPDVYNTDMTEYTVCLRLSGLDARCLTFFLEAALPAHTVVGIY
ncbi:MAG: hypothetical protein ACI3YE_01075 [Candidatus Avispirillum sp.]